jgi:SAM-dependent methyltransferase
MTAQNPLHRLSHKRYLELQIASISLKRERLNWLRPFQIEAAKVAHFGCSTGFETIALMWEFGAIEVIGLDIDEFGIQQAQNDVAEIRRAIRQSHRYLQHYFPKILQADREWWHSQVPDFFKNSLVSEHYHLEFILQDITHLTPLDADYYGLAFCDFVLHHIWLDEERAGAQKDTQSAIVEMARVAKPGGLVAAFELTRLSGKPTLDFEPLFEEAGLERVHVKETKINSEQVTEYLFEKPS